MHRLAVRGRRVSARGEAAAAADLLRGGRSPRRRRRLRRVVQTYRETLGRPDRTGYRIPTFGRRPQRRRRRAIGIRRLLRPSVRHRLPLFPFRGRSADGRTRRRVVTAPDRAFFESPFRPRRWRRALRRDQLSPFASPETAFRPQVFFAFRGRRNDAFHHAFAVVLFRTLVDQLRSTAVREFAQRFRHVLVLDHARTNHRVSREIVALVHTMFAGRF